MSSPRRRREKPNADKESYEMTPQGGSQSAVSRSRSVGRFLLNDVIGVGAEKKKRKAIPEGYKLAYTRLGQAYLMKETGEENPEEDAAAASEHVRKGSTVGMCSPQEKIGKVFGEGIYQYFDFVKFLLYTNLILFACGSVSLIAHLIIDPFQTSGVLFYENFFLSTYGPNVFHYWFWSTIFAGLLFTFAFGPWLSVRIRNRFSKIGYEDDEDRYIGTVDDDDGDVIKDETGRPKFPRRLSALRVFFSYFFFLLILAISNAITLGLVIAQADFQGGQDPILKFVFSLTISAVISVTNIVWKQVCVLLTQFEQHYTYSRFLNHHTVKFFVWRILNVCIMFLGRYLVAIGALEGSSALSFLRERYKDVGNPFADGCKIISLLAEQFMMLLIFELTAGNLIEIVVPVLWLKAQRLCCNRITGEELESGRMDFDVAEEYLELMYRQFIVYMGLPVFPTIGFLGVLVNLLEYPLDKWRLLRLAKTPPPLRGSMHSFLVFFLFLSAVISVAMFPYGVGWDLAGWGFTGNRHNCSSGVFEGGFFPAVNNTIL